MRRKIPPTQALICFESAARHENFTRAAEELALTQSAVCRQIANLESFLDVELFRRTRRGVRLPKPADLQPTHCQPSGCGGARYAVADGQQGQRHLELALVPTFGTQWLLPRMGQFLVQHPNVTINMTNRTRLPVCRYRVRCGHLFR